MGKPPKSGNDRKRRGSNNVDAAKKPKTSADVTEGKDQDQILNELLTQLGSDGGSLKTEVKQNDRIRLTQQAVDQGWIRSIVGQAIDKETKGGKNDGSRRFAQLCNVWASLLSFEGSSGRLTSATLDYLVHARSESTEKPPIQQIVMNTLLFEASAKLKKQNEQELSNDWLARLCHCLTLLGSIDRDSPNSIWALALQSLSSPSASGRTEVPAQDLMEYISPHVRELIKRQNPAFFSEDENMGDTKKLEKDPPFFVALIDKLLNDFEEEGNEMEEGDDDTNATKNNRVFFHRALEWIVDLLSLSADGPVRTFCCWYLKAIFFSIRAARSAVSSSGGNAANHLTQQLLKNIKEWQDFPLQQKQPDMNPIPRSRQETMRLHYRRATTFQKLCHRYHAHTLDDIIFAGLGLLCGSQGDRKGSSKFISSSLASLSDDQLRTLLHKLRLLDEHQDEPHLRSLFDDRTFLLQVLNDYLQQPTDALQALQTVPIFCTESLLWDATKIPPNHTSLLLPSKVLSLPKLSSTHYLSFTDYLWRNFSLLQLETASAIRSDLVSVIRRLRPVLSMSSENEEEDDFAVNSSSGNDTPMKTSFAGWARMALELQQQGQGGGLKIVKVEKPLLGESHPHEVFAECTIDLSPCGAAIRKEWDSLSEHDNIFFVAVHASPDNTGTDPPPTIQELRAKLGYKSAGDATKAGDERLVPDDDDPSFPHRYGVRLVRGGTIVQIRDEKGNVLTDAFASAQTNNDNQQSDPVTEGTKRIIKVSLDPVQYSSDMKNKVSYGSMNLVVRRHGRENSFKALLETTRSLLTGTDSVHRVLPVWLQPILLGQGSPSAANYKSTEMQEYSTKTVGVADPSAYLDYGDTFLDEAHLRESFTADEGVVSISVDGRDTVKDKDTQERKNYKIRCSKSEAGVKIEATSYERDEALSRGNPIRFTPKQIEAVRSGLSCGLTLCVGPPGTNESIYQLYQGKTDVAVQIIASLFHSFPGQRTVIITHSNAALNDIFEKVMARGDVEERYLLRLGSGERDLQTESSHDFTKLGRVQYCFGRRSHLLEQVQQLSESLGLSGRAERGADGSPSYTCESAEIFFNKTIQPKLNAYLAKVKDEKIPDKERAVLFPFKSFFSVSDELSKKESETLVERLHMIFQELAEYRPLELLRSQRQRTDYFLIKQARVVAMTSTHAAIARAHLISLGFQYDNLVVEEAGQMREIDTFIPLLLQQGESNDDSAAGVGSRLKRVCLLGDHNQLPPVIKNLTFARYSNMDQSLFARLIRLGVPCIELDKQGRTRPEIAALYNWRYKSLGNMDHVVSGERFRLANPGFTRTLQFINVEDFQEKGETAPTAFFYQNMGEAEYVVALFQFMVLIGYPAESISILTTYNGQKELIADIVEQRCGEGTPLAGVRPGAISTVDQFQGQQNDFILLSLVRTESIGHLRDIRRLVVAVSRARYGLYAFGRYDLFSSNHELRKVLSIFDDARKLELVMNETYPSDRSAKDNATEGDRTLFVVDDVEHMGAVVHQMQEDIMQQTDD